MNKGTIDNQKYKRSQIGFAITLGFISILTLFVFSARLFYMQIVNKEKYEELSKKDLNRSTIIFSQRGEIYDRNNDNALVVNSDSFSVEISPAKIPSGYYDTVAAKLANILEIPKSSIDKYVDYDKTKNDYNPYTVKRNVTFDKITAIAENITELPGVTWQVRPKRNYIETGSFSHILGYVGKIDKSEYEKYYNTRKYSINSIVGKAGIEKQYDELLQGKDGYEVKLVDVRGREVADSSTVVPPEMGKKLVLTIDSRVQYLAEKALGNRVGSIIVIKPTTGEILAMVSYPYYDSNIFNAENASEEYNKLIRNPDNPFVNRAADSSYPPASTFKVIMEAAILNEKAIPEYEKIECKGEIVYGAEKRLFHCWVEKPGHGKMDLKHALGNSCNIYFYTVGRDHLGINKIAKYAKSFGYGQSPELDLPSYSKGFVPTPEWKERKTHGDEHWQGGDTMNVSIGQGDISATPLQVADALCMVLNEGKIYKPHLLKEVRDPVTDEVIQTVEPEVLFENDIEPSVYRKVKESMRFVCTDGTAKYALQNPTVKIAAKTGTAEVGIKKQDRWHSWLLAFAPYDAPVEDQIVVCSMVEARNNWEWWATYATNIVIQGYFANQSFDESVDALNYRWLIRNSAE